MDNIGEAGAAARQTLSEGRAKIVAVVADRARRAGREDHREGLRQDAADR